mgnify:CR=1 FL=1
MNDEDPHMELCDLWTADPSETTLTEILQGTARIIAKLVFPSCPPGGATVRIVLGEDNNEGEPDCDMDGSTEEELGRSGEDQEGCDYATASSHQLMMSLDIPAKEDTNISLGKMNVFHCDGACSETQRQHLTELAKRLGRVLSHRGSLQKLKDELRSTQVRERRLLESQTLAKMGQWDLDLTTNTLVWSEGIYDIFRVDPNKFGASYEAFLNAIHPDDRGFVNNAYTNSLITRKSYNIVHRLLFEDGTIRFVNEICRSEFDPNTGEPLYSVGVVQDITELKHAQEMDRLKSAFLANMSHEIRTPLVSSRSVWVANESFADKKSRIAYPPFLQKSGAFLRTLYWATPIFS